MIVVLSAEDIREIIKNYFFIPTGSIQLDEILHGGIRSCAIHEIYGMSGSGKTQICFELLFNAITFNQGFLKDSSAVYISSKKCFFPERIKQLASRHANFDPECLLKKIMFKQVSDFENLSFAVHYLNSIITSGKNHKNIRLIVIDTFSAHIRDLNGYEKVSLSYELISILGALAQDFNIAVVLTCDMTPVLYRTHGSNEKKFIMETALGDLFAIRMSQRIELQKNENEVITVKVRKNCSGREGKANIKVDQKCGIVDVLNPLKRKFEDETVENEERE